MRVRALFAQSAQHREAASALRADGVAVCDSCGIECPDFHNLAAMHNKGARHQARLRLLASAGVQTTAHPKALNASSGAASAARGSSQKSATVAAAAAAVTDCQACGWKGSSSASALAHFKVLQQPWARMHITLPQGRRQHLIEIHPALENAALTQTGIRLCQSRHRSSHAMASVLTPVGVSAGKIPLCLTNADRSQAHPHRRSIRARCGSQGAYSQEAAPKLAVGSGVNAQGPHHQDHINRLQAAGKFSCWACGVDCGSKQEMFSVHNRSAHHAARLVVLSGQQAAAPNTIGVLEFTPVESRVSRDEVHQCT